MSIYRLASLVVRFAHLTGLLIDQLSCLLAAQLQAASCGRSSLPSSLRIILEDGRFFQLTSSLLLVYPPGRDQCAIFICRRTTPVVPANRSPSRWLSLEAAGRIVPTFPGVFLTSSCILDVRFIHPKTGGPPLRLPLFYISQDHLFRG